MREIYISCAKEDRAYKERLKIAMKPVLDLFELSLWHMDDIVPGLNWKDAMKQHLEHTAFFVPLITAHTLASDLCNIEMQAALYRTQYDALKIISILVLPCLFEILPLAGHTVLPKSGKFIAEASNQDKAWLGVQRELLVIVQSNQKYLEGR